ncbi:MAG: hypothetical protein ACK5OW_00450 [bacterium]|jgi:hypothetical protein
MSNNIQDNEVNIGPQKIGPNTVIQINLKTLLTLLGILGSGLFYLWSDISNKVEAYNKSNYDQIETLKDEIRSIKDQDLKTISIQLNQVDGKVQGIFMNVQRDIYNPNTVVNTNRQPENIIKPNSPK